MIAEEVVLSNSVESIESRAFADSQNLRLITIPDDIIIADDAFEGCDALTIICAEGGTVQAYADAHAIPCVIQ